VGSRIEAVSQLRNAGGPEARPRPLDLELDGKVVWITGASRGLGEAAAYAFSGAGARVILTARSADDLDRVAGKIRDGGGEVESVAGSVVEEETIERALGAAEGRWRQLDVLVNNAGISPAFVPSERLSREDWERTMSVNLFAPFACARAALPMLEAGEGGSVVNVSSIHGSRAHERLIAYAASKGGLEMVTRTLAVEWAARGVRVNSVAPGYLETDMTAALLQHERWGEALRSRVPMGRFGHTSEVVPAILFLAGQMASYITGSTVYVDGGWTAA
jgi:NAD(P)-dependent dehydrogenase (short-subunit alcohol dehydrogenase family)